MNLIHELYALSVIFSLLGAVTEADRLERFLRLLDQ